MTESRATIENVWTGTPARAATGEREERGGGERGRSGKASAHQDPSFAARALTGTGLR